MDYGASAISQRQSTDSIRRDNDLLDDPLPLGKRFVQSGYLYIKKFFSAAGVLGALEPRTAGDVAAGCPDTEAGGPVEYDVCRTTLREYLAKSYLPGFLYRLRHASCTRFWLPVVDLPEGEGAPALFTSRGVTANPRWEIGDLLLLSHRAVLIYTGTSRPGPVAVYGRVAQDSTTSERMRAMDFSLSIDGSKRLELPATSTSAPALTIDGMLAQLTFPSTSMR